MEGGEIVLESANQWTDLPSKSALTLAANRVNFTGICTFVDRATKFRNVFFIDLNKNFIKLTIQTDVDLEFRTRMIFKGENVSVSTKDRRHLVLTSDSYLNRITQENVQSQRLNFFYNQIEDQHRQTNKVCIDKRRKNLYEVIKSTGNLSNEFFLANGTIVKTGKSIGPSS